MLWQAPEEDDKADRDNLTVELVLDWRAKGNEFRLPGGVGFDYRKRLNYSPIRKKLLLELD